ncbi:MAG: hypothetical protein ACTSR1_00100 [Candidatus Heimdallarchaeota archaeon]
MKNREQILDLIDMWSQEKRIYESKIRAAQEIIGEFDNEEEENFIDSINSCRISDHILNIKTENNKTKEHGSFNDEEIN